MTEQRKNNDRKDKPTVGRSADQRIDALCDRFEAEWGRGGQPRIEDFLAELQVTARPTAFSYLLVLEVELCSAQGNAPKLEDYEKRFPDYQPEIAEVFASLDDREQATVDHVRIGERHGLHVRCPHCHNPIELVTEAKLDEIDCPSCGSSFHISGSTTATGVDQTPRQFAHFQLTEQLGMGAFGSVWRAQDMQLDRTVAVKIPRKGTLSVQEEEAFLREARAAAQLKHPNIVSVHEIGREGDQVYIVSDLVEGSSLAERLEGGPLTSREAAKFCAKIAEALEHAHQQKVIHRDLKPQNIMIDKAGEPQILDFGLAKRDAGEITMTLDGAILGTPAYMSPEQASGQSHKVDRTSDVYSLGVLLFQMLTGELPFRGTTQMLIYKVINEEPPSPRQLDNRISRNLETIVLKCLKKDRGKRYSTAADLASDLRCVLTNNPIQAKPAGWFETGWCWCHRHPHLVSSQFSMVGACLIAIAIDKYSEAGRLSGLSSMSGAAGLTDTLAFGVESARIVSNVAGTLGVIAFCMAFVVSHLFRRPPAEPP